MAHSVEFNIDQALDKAMDMFWSKGYEPTSMDDLMKAMDLNEDSIYTAFGDKHSLFIDALTQYTDATYKRLKKIFAEAKTPYEGMETFFTDVLVSRSTESGLRKGCFTVNSIIELGPHDNEVKDILNNQTTRLEALFAGVLAKGQEAGEFRDDIKAEDMAVGVSVLIFGIMADCKMGNCKTRAEKIANTYLRTLKAA